MTAPEKLHEDIHELKTSVLVLSIKLDRDAEERRIERERQLRRDEKIDHVLFGNGKPGIVEEVRSLKQNQQGFIRLAWISITAGVTAAGGWLWRVIAG